MASIVIIKNITASSVSYLSGSITIPGNTNYNVSTNDIFSISLDPQFRSDLNANLVQINDGASNYSSNNAINYLNRIIGTKDKDGVGITSSSVGPKQALDVNVISSTSIYTNKYLYAEITSVPSNTESTIISYTVPNTKSGLLNSVDVSGNNIAEYLIYLNGVVVHKKRTMFGSNLNTSFLFVNEGLQLTSNDVVAVKVIHLRPYVGSFNASLQLKEET